MNYIIAAAAKTMQWFKFTGEDIMNSVWLLVLGMVTLVAMMAVLMLVAIVLGKVTGKKKSKEEKEG